MPTTYRGSLGFLALVSLIVFSLGCPLRAVAQTEEPVVAIDSPQAPVELQATFSVAVTIEDVSELQAYEFTLRYDPAVVEVQAVELGAFLEGQPLGPDINNEAGTVTFGVFGLPGGSGAYPSGAGELAAISLKAVGEGFTELDLQDVELFGPDGDQITTAVEDGQVQVGEGDVPTGTPTEEAVASDTPAPTSTATSPPGATATKTPTGGATSPPEATATKTPTGEVTSAPKATATKTATGAVTSPAGATATEGSTPVATSGATRTAQPGQTPVEEGSPSATVEMVGGGGGTVEPAATSGNEAEGETPSGVTTSLIVVAALLGLAGIALIGVGVFAFGVRRQPDREPMDGDTE